MHPNVMHAYSASSLWYTPSNHPSIHLSIFIHLSGKGSHGTRLSSDPRLLSPQSSPPAHQWGYWDIPSTAERYYFSIKSPESPVFLGTLCRKSLTYLYYQESGRHPHQMPKPPEQVRLGVEEKQLNDDILWVGRVPRLVPQGGHRHPLREGQHTCISRVIL